MEQITYKLKTPVEHNGTTISELSFREPLVGDAVAMDYVKGDLDKTLAFLAAISDTPLPAIKKIRLAELTEISAKIAPLMGNSEALPAEAGST